MEEMVEVRKEVSDMPCGNAIPAEDAGHQTEKDVAGRESDRVPAPEMNPKVQLELLSGEGRKKAIGAVVIYNAVTIRGISVVENSKKNPFVKMPRAPKGARTKHSDIAYAMARMLNDRGLCTRQGARFQSVNIRRMIRHEGYTGYLITKAARSEFIQELQIVDEKLFARANEVIDCRSKKLAQEKNIAAKTNNPTLLAGIVVCAHCGAKMSAFLHTDRYKLADGTIREKVQAKYNCYQRGQKLRACDGQSLYLAERVDAVVLEVVHDIFRRIQQEPYDRSIEQKLRQENGEQERQKQAAEKKIKAAQYKQKRYEDEVIRCLDGQSRFSEEMLARLIAEAETEVRQAKEEYAELLRNDTTRATIQQIRSYYDEFLGWANEFDLATIPRKRAILGQLIEKVEVGKGYKVTVHLRMSYAQFLGIEGNGEIQVRKDVCA